MRNKDWLKILISGRARPRSSGEIMSENKMAKRKADPEIIIKILKERGYKDGKPPKGHEAHHIKPLAKGGKDTPGNIMVIKATKHRQIHKNRRERGEE